MTLNSHPAVKKFLLALALSLFAITASRFLSPTTVIDGYDIFLAWLPLSVAIAMLLLFGRHAVLPLMVAFALTNAWMLPLPVPQAIILLFCQLFAPLLSCGILRRILGRRWRFGLPNMRMGQRIFWCGFVAPFLMKGAMYYSGHFFNFPIMVAGFFISPSIAYSIIDVQNLICAVLIFTMLFYYPLRMILNPRYGRKFWKNNIAPVLRRDQRLFTINWLLALIIALLVLCSPFESQYIAGYLVPVVFILFFLAIRRFSYPLISVLWSISVFFLVAYNHNFLQGVKTEYALSFIMSVLISFTICMLYMMQIYRRGNLIKRKWQSQALEDPLTGLPNLRALEGYLARYPHVSVCCLRMHNLEFLGRHYGMMMRVYCKREISAKLQPLLCPKEQLFLLPGSELLLVLHGSGVGDRLSSIVDYLNSKKFIWQNNPLDLEFGASWGVVEGEGERLHHMLGQLSWLSEQSCIVHRVQALDISLDVASDNTTERVILLGTVKKALAQGGLRLYAQPIVDCRGGGYHEILSRLEYDGQMLTPDRFIPVIEQFNLSKRFDLLVMETLLSSMQRLPEQHFSVNLMPFTLMQKETAGEIIALFETYRISPALISIEITEQQAFYGSEISDQNIRRLRRFGCKIAIDDFGTGYANYERLKRLEADVVKIDGCFIHDIISDAADKIIVKSICELARVKNLKVVAEFVETEEQREQLFALGIDYLQGYLIGKPLPLSELKA